MNLQAVCESLGSNKDDPISFDKILSDFISTFSTGTFEFSAVSNDQFLENFVQLVLEPFARINPENSDSLKYTQLFSKFVISIASSSPSISSLISKYFPLEKVLNTACDQIPIEVATNLIEVTAYATNGAYLSIIQNESLSSVFKNYLQLLKDHTTLSFAMCSLAGLLRSHPIFLSFVRASADLKSFRDITTTSLSCDDHLCVVSSLSALLAIFPRSIDSDTTKCAALHAISVSGDNLLLLRTAIALLTDISVVPLVDEDDFNTVVQCAIATSGMKAYILYDGINRLLMNRETGIPLTGKSINLDSVINVLVSTPNGFIAQSIMTFIDQLQFQREDLFDSLTDASTHAFKAIRLLSAPPNTIDIELLEGAATILKLFALSKNCLKQIEDVLIQGEETLFVAFQRHIESSEPYVSLLLFLFLSVAAKHIESWKKRIRLAIIDSQFSALLAHIIESSTDRKALVDAISALSEITQFEFGEKLCDHSVIFDSIISGFMTINLRSKEERKKFEENVESRVIKVQQIADGMKAQIECDELEIQTLYNKQDELERENEEMRQKIAQLEEDAKGSNSKIEELTATKNDQATKIEALTIKVSNLTKENDTNKNIIDQQKNKIQDLNNLVEDYKAKEPGILKTERANAAYEVKVQELNQNVSNQQEKIQEQAKQIEQLKLKLKDVKQEFAAKSEDFHNREIEREKTQIEINELKTQLAQSEESKKNAHDKVHLIKEKLRETIKVLEEMQQRDIDNRREIEDLERKNNELAGQLNTILAEKKQFELIAQFVHRITDETPIPPDQLMTMLDDTKN